MYGKVIKLFSYHIIIICTNPPKETQEYTMKHKFPNASLNDKVLKLFPIKSFVLSSFEYSFFSTNAHWSRGGQQVNR